MPRLLLVDDNPSIHRSAEIQLGPTGIDLVYAGSAEEALGLISDGQTFDAALVDILMPGMDGWALLQALRQHPATSQMPVALMAGVLEEVDADRVAAARIQGFLKKPTEFGRLAERVQEIMATPVPDPAPAPEASTTTSMAIMDLPEARMDMEMPEALADDVLMLDASDLLEPETAAPLAPAEPLTSAWEEPEPAEPPSLDLEELDLGSLRTLDTPEAPDTSAPTPLAVADPFPVPGPTWEDVPATEPAPPSVADLPDLGGELELEPLAEAWEEPVVAAEPEPAPEPAPEPFDPEMLMPPVTLVAAVEPTPTPEPIEAPVAAPVAIPLAVSTAAPQELLQALLADPAALDALAKAVVARLGDQALREIAWELMPDLADRLRK